LDFAKAFDIIWHEGLLYKLKNIFPASLYLILKFYLENRSFNVRYNLKHSNQYPIFAGVPQGSSIVPFLYTILAELPIVAGFKYINVCNLPRLNFVKSIEI
jgi:hypothetical protein